MTVEKLMTELLACKKKKMTYRFLASAKNSVKSSDVRANKKSIARINTVLREKRGA